MRLRNLAPQATPLASPIGYQRDAHGHSDDLEPWRRKYKLSAWQKLRQRVFLRDNFTCQCGCGTVILNPRERIADHIDEAAKYDDRRFFADAEVQTLWKPHHDGWKQRLERRDRTP